MRQTAITRDLLHVHLGRRDYASTLALQTLVFRAKADRASRLRKAPTADARDALEKAEGPPFPDVIFSVEHSPGVVTMGRRDTSAGLRDDAHPIPNADGGGAARSSDPADAPPPLFRTRRGGGLTWHGPGQTTVYPIVDFRGLWRRAPENRGVVVVNGGPQTNTPNTGKGSSPLRWYVSSLECGMCHFLERYKLKPTREHNGVWLPGESANTSSRKVGFVGIEIDEHVSMHGLCVNVMATSEPPFERFVMCELEGRHCTSLEAAVRGAPFSLEALAADREAATLAQRLRLPSSRDDALHTTEQRPPPSLVTRPDAVAMAGYQVVRSLVHMWGRVARESTEEEVRDIFSHKAGP